MACGTDSLVDLRTGGRALRRRGPRPHRDAARHALRRRRGRRDGARAARHRLVGNQRANQICGGAECARLACWFAHRSQRRLRVDSNQLLYHTSPLIALAMLAASPLCDDVAHLAALDWTADLRGDVLWSCAVWNQILRRVRAEASRRPPRHRRDACSMAWRCRFLAARPSHDGRVIAEK